MTSAFCPRCRSAWSIKTNASIASEIGVARIPTHGSWRPVVTTSRWTAAVQHQHIETARRAQGGPRPRRPDRAGDPRQDRRHPGQLGPDRAARAHPARPAVLHGARRRRLGPHGGPAEPHAAPRRAGGSGLGLG